MPSILKKLASWWKKWKVRKTEAPVDYVQRTRPNKRTPPKVSFDSHSPSPPVDRQVHNTAPERASLHSIENLDSIKEDRLSPMDPNTGLRPSPTKPRTLSSSRSSVKSSICPRPSGSNEKDDVKRTFSSDTSPSRKSFERNPSIDLSMEGSEWRSNRLLKASSGSNPPNSRGGTVDAASSQDAPPEVVWSNGQQWEPLNGEDFPPLADTGDLDVSGTGAEFESESEGSGSLVIDPDTTAWQPAMEGDTRVPGSPYERSVDGSTKTSSKNTSVGSAR
ncbi:hypothetical protein FB567DRAFT_55484 [Paraphoma chrysanthemicola]|uniref:Uncharacterized protein n=1 Tax=Paraphoma chrysanthemicola TaxID=798071 RepID=A0A8K0VXY7_9PLEO|nr:hypothetical protein FB567DRAFT_55484 [Paraphoma chrysanthemicola]